MGMEAELEAHWAGKPFLDAFDIHPPKLAHGSRGWGGGAQASPGFMDCKFQQVRRQIQTFLFKKTVDGVSGKRQRQQKPKGS